MQRDVTGSLAIFGYHDAGVVSTVVSSTGDSKSRKRYITVGVGHVRFDDSAVFVPRDARPGNVCCHLTLDSSLAQLSFVSSLELWGKVDHRCRSIALEENTSIITVPRFSS